MYLKTIQFKCFDSLEIKESLFNKFELPKHIHDTYCIGLLNSGTKQCTIEEKNQLIPSNSISIINPFQVHADKNIDNQNCLFRMIYINKDVLNFFLKEITNSHLQNIHFSNDLIMNPQAIKIINSFFDTKNDKGILEEKLKNLVAILISQKHYIEKKKSDNRYQNTILESIENAHSTFTEKIDINKMARNCYLSKYQFIRYFKKSTGLTPATYLILLRINHAKKLLLTNVPIGDIALEVGFYDHAQFCKYFKHYTNMSPSQYQQNCNIVQI